MGYDPKRHNRKSIRLIGYDYPRDDMYYVTICTRDRLPILSKIENNGIPTHYPNVAIDDCILMPNHLHGILIFYSKNKDVSNPDSALASNAPPLSLGSIIGGFGIGARV